MLYSKIIRVAFALLIPFLLSSCFELEEEIYLKKNGSGTYQFRVDMSELKTMIEAMGDKKSEGEEAEDDGDMMSQSKEGMEKTTKELNEMEGISNARNIGNEEEYIFGFAFDFESVEALNNATHSRDKNKKHEGDYYSFSKGVFKKLAFGGMDELTGSMGKGEQDSEQVAQMLSQVDYSFTLRTEGKIKKFSNTKATLKDKQELIFKASFKDIMDKKVKVANEIKIK
jgi:hypothetical protein